MYLNSPESLSLRLQHGVTTLENLVVEREVFDTFCNVIHCILNVYVEVQCECVYVVRNKRNDIYLNSVQSLCLCVCSMA